MSSESEEESMEGEVEVVKASADWGRAKRDYYYTDYIDKDYPSKLSAKEERLAALEQEEALRLQKKLLSTLDSVNLQPIIDVEEATESADSTDQTSSNQEDLIDILVNQNRSIDLAFISRGKSAKKRKRITFEEAEKNASESDSDIGSGDYNDNEEDGEEEDEDEDDDSGEEKKQSKTVEDANSKRRPINIAIRKNRGLTPYKKKEYRNPRVKHKNKYRKAMSKRRRLVKEAQVEYHRYSGEANGIKTSTIKSIKLS